MDRAAWLDYVYEQGPNGVALLNLDGSVRELNQVAAELTGRSAGSGLNLGLGVQGLGVQDLVHPDDLEECLLSLSATLTFGSSGPVDFRIRDNEDSHWRWLRAWGTYIPDPVDPVVHLLLADVSAIRATISQLAEAHHQQSLVAGLGDAALGGMAVETLLVKALEAVVRTLKVPFAGVLLDDGHPDGLILAGAIGRLENQVGIYRRPRTHMAVSQPLRERGLLLSGDLTTETRWGPVSENPLVGEGIVSIAAAAIETRTAPPGLLSVGSDQHDYFGPEDLTFLESIANVVAGAIDADNTLQTVRHSSLHDSLSGLPNRALVLDRLQQALVQSSRRGSQVGVLICDVDQFKFVNDGMGHAAGDIVLRVIADRLRDEVRPEDTVGRFGGDEFVVVCPDISDVDEVTAIARRLATAVSPATNVLGAPLVVTVSIGISIGGGSGEETAAELLREADAAMYHAKAGGRNRWVLFDNEMRSFASRRLTLAGEVRRAINNDELVLHYQPVLSTAAPQSVVGVEALVRWQHPERGLVSPGVFLGIATEMGLLLEIGEWVLKASAMQAAAWVEAGWWGQRWMAINLAPTQVVDPELPALVDRVVELAGIDPHLLRLELTEESLVDDSHLALGVIEAIRRRGLGISIDDFGTGYSSLAYLKRLPVDMLKLDQSFVSGLGHDRDDEAIASAVMGMAAALGLTVVAEGVETPRQLEVLLEMGCEMVQGFLYTPALPADQVASWIAARG